MGTNTTAPWPSTWSMAFPWSTCCHELAMPELLTSDLKVVPLRKIREVNRNSTTFPS